MSKTQNLSKNTATTPVVQEPVPGPRQHPRKAHIKKKKNSRF